METYSQKLLRKLRTQTRWSYYRISQELQVTRGNVSRWKSGTNGMSEDAALKAAELLQLDKDVVLTELQISRTDSETARRIWKKHLSMLINRNS